jgi:AcrR family transcriptional regulator
VKVRDRSRSVKIGDTIVSHELQPKRKYELKKRATEMAETHRRITEAAIELHGTVGPARTTLSAVAKRAGVERRTLYRHFPSEAELFEACSAHYFATHPLPDLEAPLASALDELYAYYERTAAVLGNALRDAELVEYARDAVAPLDAFLDEATGVLIAGREGRLVEAAVRHGVAFSTWRSLTANGVSRSDAVRLVSALVEAAA